MLKIKDQIKAKANREQFADGSAVVTYPDGSVLIVESDLAKSAVLGEAKTVNYRKAESRRREK